MRHATPLVVASGALVAFIAGCPPAAPPPVDLSERLAPGQLRAGVVGKESDLIGGPTSVGAIGDFKLYNDRIAVIVEAAGPSDGYGIYGGLVVDADVIRPEGQPGRSAFGEALPLYGFITVEATDAQVVNDGTDGKDAIVRVRGKSAPFGLLDAVLGDPDRAPGTVDGDHPDLAFETDYVLSPSSNALKVVTRVSIPDPDLVAVAVNNHFAGYVMGDGLRMFLPTHGFDIPSVPEAGDYFAGASRDVSYSFVHVGGRFVPIVQVEGFQLGTLPRFDAMQGEPIEVVSYLVVGDGDLAAHLPVHDAIKLAADEEVPERVTLSGRVEEAGGKAVAGAFVHVRRKNGDYVIRATTKADGTFSARLPADEYTLTATLDGRDPGPDASVTVAGDTSAILSLGPVGRLTVSATEGGQPVPFKVQLRRTTPPPAPPAAFGLEPRHRGYERIEFLPPGGATLELPPGEWIAYVSRGFEYELVRQDVTIVAGETAQLAATLARSVETTGWVGGDYHVHSQWSPDSDDLVEFKVLALAGEGVETPVSTEHDYVGDFTPQVAKLGLGKWVRGLVGTEVSTTPYGHFNAFPLVRDPTQASYGFVSWWGKRGDDLMKSIRARAPEALIQVNHPRSGSFGSPVVKGYFSATGFQPDTFAPQNPKHWSTDYDAMEVANGGRPGDDEFADWFAFLDRGRRLLGTGNSDSHTAKSDFVGYPRNYVRTGTDAPDQVVEADFMAQLRAGRLTVSGGYFVDAVVGEKGLGDLVRPSGEGDALIVDVSVRAPSWVPGGSGEALVNGIVVGTFQVPVEDVQPGRRVATTMTLPVPAGVDSYVIVRATGGDLGPVYPGAGAFGFTNPIYVDGDGDGTWTGRLPMP